MMKYVCQISDDLKQNDDIFSSHIVNKKAKRGHPLHVNNQNLSNRMLAEKLNSKDIEIHTYSYYLNHDLVPDLIIFQDIPKFFLMQLLEKWSKAKKFLILYESEVIKPWNWDDSLHDYFDKIFTWHLDYINEDKYIHLPSINTRFDKQDITINLDYRKRKKLSTLISSNNFSNHPLELYSSRLNTINWFAENHIKDLDLYGPGWDQLKIKGKSIFVKVFNRMKFSNKLFVHYSKVYKGVVEDKVSILSNYRFNFTYENAIDIPGYVTEKIFHSFVSGAVPVYLGPPEDSLVIPKACYVNRRDFLSHEDLYFYLVNMTENDYKEMQNNIINFLGSDKGKMFSVENFVEILFNNISKDIRDLK